MFTSAIARTFLLTLVVVSLLVLLRGDRWGRASVLLHDVNFMLVAALMRRHQPHVFQTPDFIVDCAGAAAACAIAIASRQLWAAALAGFQLVGVANYLTRPLDPTIHPQIFVVSTYVWEAGALACLVWAGLRFRTPKLEGNLGGKSAAKCLSRWFHWWTRQGLNL